MNEEYIKVGIDTLVAIYEYLNRDSTEPVHAIGMQTNKFGGDRNYFDTIQMTFNSLGFTLVKDGKFVEDHVPIANAYKSFVDDSLIIETENGRYVLTEYRALVMENE